MARLSGATSAIDVSDGLLADLGHLARASGVGVALDTVPVMDGATLDEALGVARDSAGSDISDADALGIVARGYINGGD